MYRSHSSKPYDILRGIHYPANISSLFAYLSYFPPPPPVIPGPPPQRAWTCSVHSFSPSSCFVSDDLNPPSLRTYVPLTVRNHSSVFENISYIPEIIRGNSTSSFLSPHYPNKIILIFLLIILPCIFIFVILFLLLFLYIQRTRQRQLASNTYRETNNNFELNNTSKNKKFYYHLIPYREKRQKPTTTLRNTNDDNNLLRSTNHDASALEIVRLTTSSGTHINDSEEQEETL